MMNDYSKYLTFDQLCRIIPGTEEDVKIYLNAMVGIGFFEEVTVQRMGVSVKAYGRRERQDDDR